MIQQVNITKNLLKHLAGEMLSDDYKASLPVKSIAGSALKCFGHKGLPSEYIRDTAQQVYASYSNAPNYQYNKNEAILAQGILEFERYVNQ
ncbi:MAG: hypothetical protein U0M80_02510 [Fusobacterium mortiferum]|jgi:hypothetical protein|uniref:hypothetical protein n=1 Tax=uncultured Fusobacterium sp. TaxID=159267 RepID=UPI0025F7F74D|nr:hypothetical protein [uncultured Fusobacterium sp.]